MTRLCLAALLLLCTRAAAASEPFLGVAYQTWNKPLGVYQSAEQLEWDLRRMRALGVRSLRVEWVWAEIEPRPGVFDFSKPELLVKLCRKLGIRLLPLIGFQWPPPWVGPEHRLGYQPGKTGGATERSPIMNFADPWVRARLARYVRAVVGHFRGDATISAWVLGNEFSYEELDTKRQLGHDPESLQSFRRDLQARFGGAQAVAQRWRTPLASLDAVGSEHVRIDRDSDVLKRPVLDFLDFRRRMLAATVGEACRAARDADPAARRTYSSVGVLFMPYDEHALSEDWSEIARSCRRAAAPLSFFSLNSYQNLNTRGPPHLGLSRELGRALTRDATTSGDVIFSEFGNTSTDIHLTMDETRQGPMVVAELTEGLFDGIPSMHLFTWNDKPYVSTREQGFGVVRDKREAKPALHSLERFGAQLDQLDVDGLRARLLARKRPVAILTPDTDGLAQWSSWLDETWLIATYLRRLDVPLTFITPEQLTTAEPREFSALLLSRQEMAPLATLRRAREWLRRGVHLVAISGVPGLRAGEGESEWHALIDELFGLSFEPAHFEAQRGPFANAWLHNTDGSRTLFGTWLIHLPRDGRAVEVSQDRLALESHPPAPLYYRKRHGAAQAIYVPVALGLVVDPLQQHPVEPITARLGALLRTLDIAVEDRNLDLTRSRALAVRRRPLAGGGELVFLHHWPVLPTGTLAPCGGEAAPVRVAAPAGSRWVGLLSGALHVAASDGLVVPLRACEAELLASEAQARALRRSAVSQPAPPGERERARAFPQRVHLDGPPDGCLAQRLEQAGYVTAALGVGHSPDYRSWWTEPVRGRYSLPRHELERRASSFGVLAFDDTPAPAWIDQFAADPARRVVVRADRSRAAWSQMAGRANVVLLPADCAAIDARGLSTVVEGR
jgi:hypothetical protein